MLKASSLPIGHRIWLVLGLSILPLFALTVLDYVRERNARLQNYEYDARLMLNGILIAEEEQKRHVEALLRTFAGADNMRSGRNEDCASLAVRMLAAHPDLANLGAVDGQGQVFCSGVSTSQPVSVADRTWFQHALTQEGLTPGQFTVGRISGQTGVTFGLPVRDAAGQLRFVLFAATRPLWFDRFTALNTLPEQWTSLLFTREGQALSRYPEPERWRGRSLPPASLASLQAAIAAGRDHVRMLGLDGVDRLFVMQPLKVAGGELIATVGVPVEHTLTVVERDFHERLLLVLVIAAVSLLLAYRLLGELIDRRFSQTLTELRHLKHALDRVPAYVYIKDDARRYQYANQRTLELFGVTADALRGQDDTAFFPADSAQRLAAIDLAVLAGQESNVVIDRLDGPAGVRYYHEIKTPILDEASGRPQGLIGITNDITEQQLALEQVRKLSRAIEQSPESIVFTDLEARIEYVNETFLRITGYSREEVIGQNPRILQSGRTPREQHRRMWATLTRGETWKGEFINRRKDGSEFIEAVLVSPVRDERGRTTHYVSVKQDITERRRNEEELAEYRNNLERLVDQRTRELAIAKEAAEAANRAKSSFLANMSHEIRTPMNAIIGLNYLLQQSPLTQDQREKTRKVDQAAHQLLQVINDILDLSRIEAGRLELEPQAFSPGEVIQEVALLIRERAEAKGLELAVEDSGLPPRLLGDATRLRQVLINFAGNAVKFTEKGSIRLRGEVLKEDGDDVICRFSVTDTGIGIQNEQLPRLFHAFEQLDASTTRQYGGSGLGLAIARRLALLMGGDVGVDTRPGAGSTFWMTARLARCSDAASPASTPVVRQQLQGRVLLVEDDATSREVGVALLQAMGLQVSAVENGQQAVEAVEHEHFDLVLMDLQMPVLDGIAATRAIRQRPASQALTIVALTANVFDSDRERCLEAGMNDFIGKPVSAAQLQRVLSSHLPPAGGENPPVSGDEAPPLTREALREGLGQMLEMLRVGNVDAGQIFQQLRAAIVVTDAGLAEQLELLLAAYDYEAALLLTESLIDELDRKAV